MSGFFVTPTSGAAVPVNPDDTYEALGFGTDGALTVITAAGTAHTKGSYATIGTTANALAGFWIEVGDASASGVRLLADIRVGGATIIVPDLYLMPSTAGSGRIWWPINIAAGTLIEARVQSATASATVRLAISGRIRNANHPTLFSSATSLLTADTANTNPNTTNVPLASSLGSYTTLVASTAATYGAVVATVGFNGTNPAASQQSTTIVAVGAAASEVQIARIAAHIATTAPQVVRAHRTLEQGIPSGSRLAAACLAPTPGSDNLRVQLHGFA